MASDLNHSDYVSTQMKIWAPFTRTHSGAFSKLTPRLRTPGPPSLIGAKSVKHYLIIEMTATSHQSQYFFLDLIKIAQVTSRSAEPHWRRMVRDQIARLCIAPRTLE